MNDDDNLHRDIAHLISAEPILRWFAFDHLPDARLRNTSRPFAQHAYELMALPRSAERTVALRKLLESKDAAVRATLFEPAPVGEALPAP